MLPRQISDTRRSLSPSLFSFMPCSGNNGTSQLRRNHAHVHAAIDHDAVAGDQIRALDQPDDDGGDFLGSTRAAERRALPVTRLDPGLTRAITFAQPLGVDHAP